MVSYAPPTAILPFFNPAVFETDETALTIGEANKLYFKKSGGIIYGSVSMPSLTLNGVNVENKLLEIDTVNAKLTHISYNNNVTYILNDLSINGVLKLNGLTNTGQTILDNKLKTTKISYDSGNSVTTIGDTLKASSTLIVGNLNYNASDEFYKLTAISRGATPLLTITDAVDLLGILNLPNHGNVDTILTNFDEILVNMSYLSGTNLLTINSNVKIPQNLELNTITDVEQKIIDISNTTTNLETILTGISYNTIQDLTTIDNSLNVTGNLQLNTITDVEQKIIDISNNAGGSIPSITYDALTSTTTFDGSFVIFPSDISFELGLIPNLYTYIVALNSRTSWLENTGQGLKINNNTIIEENLGSRSSQLSIRPKDDIQDAVQEIYSKNGTSILKLGDDNGTTKTFSNILKSENGNATFYGNNSGETKFMEYNSTDDKINIFKDMDLGGNILYIDNLYIQEATGTPPSGQKGSLTLIHDDAGGTSSIVFRSSRDPGVDHGYISYQDDYDGSITLDRSLLEIGCKNDSGTNTIDNIALMPSGFVGINTRTPEYMLDLSGNMRTYNTIIGKRPFFNTDGDGISIKPLTNPSINGGSIFEVRSTAFASRLFCGQALTSSGQNPFYFGYFGNNGEEADSTKYNGVLATNGSVDCTEIKVNSIPINSFTSFNFGVDYTFGSRSWGQNQILLFKNSSGTPLSGTPEKTHYSHQQQFTDLTSSEFTCNSNFFGTYEITADVIYRNDSGNTRQNPCIGISISSTDASGDIYNANAPDFSVCPYGQSPFSAQYVRMTEGRVCSLNAKRIHHFTSSITDKVSIRQFIHTGGNTPYDFSEQATSYRILMATIKFKYIGNFDNIT